MDLDKALAWAADRKHGVLITIRRDGRPQSSDIVYGIDGSTILVSVTDDRAKTVNMSRDPRVVLHVTEPGSFSYVSFDSTAELSPVCADPSDAVADQLVSLHRIISGAEHPDWDEFRRAMVDDRRLVARIRPLAAVGQIN